MTDDQYDALMTKIGTLGEAFHEFKGSQEAKVEHLEAEAKSDRMWGRIQTGVILPITGIAHLLLKHFKV